MDSLPTLPNSLIRLVCENNQLTSLPTLPNTLEWLLCSGNQLISLPFLPNSLTILECENNQLVSLPTLPNSLLTLYCYHNQLTSLPSLPDSLQVLDCPHNQLSSLPALPVSLDYLICNNNQLSSLPPLPNTLTSLPCHNNNLTSLPTLPISLASLYCQNNQLINMPNLPSTIDIIICNNNQLSSFPAVPNSMETFHIQNNNIFCLQNLPQLVLYPNISSNPLSCVPNQTYYSGSLPLCLDNDTLNNPNNCPAVSITGRVYKDLNGNCNFNTNDLKSVNLPVKLYDSQNSLVAQSYTINGEYSFANLLPDSFLIKIDTVGVISMDCGQSNTQTVTLNTSNQSIQNINFPVQCAITNDLFVQSSSSFGWVFPGQEHNLKIRISNSSNWFNLQCDTANYSGTATIQVNGPVSFVAPATGALVPTVNGNIFSYNVSDFNSLNPNSFGLRFSTDTTAQAGDQICVHVEINPTPIDADTTNNVYDFCYQVVNSYDPNMKEVYPVNVLPGYDDWFTYTIHFQNTGNAPAFNIRLRDTLDTQLDVSTFEMLGYSHPAVVSLNGNILTVRFNNIMLPDSTTDYDGSMGYFQYRIKPLPNLPNGSQIENTAYIYFDYNAPIITNTTQNNFDIAVSLQANSISDFGFVIYPNPSNGVFSFKDTKNLQTVEVFNLVGERILSQGNQKEINLSNFANGIYFAKINGMEVIKLVKE